nr:cobalamin-binding protein [Aliikangiella sp. G2MR2-5]
MLATNAVGKEIKRIVALSPHSVEMLYAIGAGDRIVGTVEHADFPEKAKEIPRIGNYVGVNIEELVALKPDLVVGWKTGNKQSDLKKIASLGFDLFYTHPLSVAEVGEDMLRLGKKVGKVNEANTAVEKMNRRYQSIKQRFSDKEKVRVFYQLWYDPIRTVGPDSWVEALIEDCNGKNIFDDASTDYPIVSLESVLAKNPQTIVMASHSEKVKSRQMIWDKWNNISAVKHEQLYVIDGSLLLRASPRALDGLEMLCGLIDKARTF